MTGIEGDCSRNAHRDYHGPLHSQIAGKSCEAWDTAALSKDMVQQVGVTPTGWSKLLERQGEDNPQPSP